MLQYFGGDLASCFPTWIMVIFRFNEPLFIERIGYGVYGELGVQLRNRSLTFSDTKFGYA